MKLTDLLTDWERRTFGHEVFKKLRDEVRGGEKWIARFGDAFDPTHPSFRALIGRSRSCITLLRKLGYASLEFDHLVQRYHFLQKRLADQLEIES